MTGHFQITASARPDGVTYLSAQSFRAPLHLSKPHQDAGALVANMVNPTAGLFDGDQIEIEATAQTGANLVLTTPSASRVYRSRNGGPARVRQRFQVEAGGFLEYYPEPFIPQAGARFHQHTELRAAVGGTLLCFDWLSPGRTASGEAFQYSELLWDLDAWSGECLVARERYRLRPADDSLETLRGFGPETHYVSVVGLGAFGSLDDLDSLSTADTYLGHGPLVSGGCLIKALCRDSLSARRLLPRLRARLHAALGRPGPPRLGRF